jgi:hypothetical protein
MKDFVFQNIIGQQIVIQADSIESACKILDTDFNKIHRLVFKYQILDI